VTTIDGIGRAAVATDELIFVVRPDGTVAWSSRHGLRIRAMAFASSGGLVVAGVYGKNVAIVRRYDPNGGELWSRWYTASGANLSWNAIALDRFDSIAVAGIAHGGVDDMIDAIVARIAPDGTSEWSRSWIGSPGFEDAFTTVHIAASGDVHAAGRTYLTSHTPYWTTAWRHLSTWWSRTGDLRATHVGDGQDTSTALLESASGAIISAGGRFQQNFVNSGYTPLGAHLLALRPQSRTLCVGDAQSNACPCANASTPGAQEGCANSTGRGARLVDGGLASLAADTLTLTVEGTTPNAPGLYFQGSVASGPVFLADGLVCAGGTLRRLYTRSATGGTSTVPGPGDPSLSARAALAGDVLAPGATRVYQVNYRDTAAAFCAPPAGGASNLSSALAVTWGL
jgi:hypothetical protein